MRDQSRLLFVFVALTYYCQLSLGASTSTDDLDDSSLFWMNESRNLKEPHWSSHGDTMFLTGADLSSRGKLLSTSEVHYDISVSQFKTMGEKLEDTRAALPTKDDAADEEANIGVHREIVEETSTFDTDGLEVSAGSVGKINAETRDILGGTIDMESVPDEYHEHLKEINEKAGGLEGIHPSADRATFEEDLVDGIASASDNDSNVNIIRNSETAKVKDSIMIKEHTEIFKVESDSVNTTKLGNLGENDPVADGIIGHDQESAMAPFHSHLENNERSNVSEEVDLKENINNPFSSAFEDVDNHDWLSTEILPGKTSESIQEDSNIIDFDAIDKIDSIPGKAYDSRGKGADIESPQNDSRGCDDYTDILDCEHIQNVTTGEILPLGNVSRVDNSHFTNLELNQESPVLAEKMTSCHEGISQSSLELLKSTLSNELIQVINQTEIKPQNFVSDEKKPKVFDEVEATKIISLDLEKEEGISYGYTSIWGKRKQGADEKVLQSMLLGKHTGLLTQSSSNPEEATGINATKPDISINPALSSDDATVAHFESDKIKSVNDEFVKGLDDINKLFEHVQPPDELDVGAAGSSMQEVLMGQGAQILRKRVAVGIEYLKDFLYRHFPKEFPSFSPKQTIGIARNWIMEECRRVITKGRDLVKRFMNDDDIDVLDFNLLVREEESKLLSLRQKTLKELADEKSSLDTSAADKVTAFIQERFPRIETH